MVQCTQFVQTKSTHNFTLFEFSSKSHRVDLGLKNETSYICHEYKIDSIL
jgi:hypothetical protein